MGRLHDSCECSMIHANTPPPLSSLPPPHLPTSHLPPPLPTSHPPSPPTSPPPPTIPPPPPLHESCMIHGAAAWPDSSLCYRPDVSEVSVADHWGPGCVFQDLPYMRRCCIFFHANAEDLGQLQPLAWALSRRFGWDVFTWCPRGSIVWKLGQLVWEGVVWGGIGRIEAAHPNGWQRAVPRSQCVWSPRYASGACHTGGGSTSQQGRECDCGLGASPSPFSYASTRFSGPRSVGGGVSRIWGVPAQHGREPDAKEPTIKKTGRSSEGGRGGGGEPGTKSGGC